MIAAIILGGLSGCASSEQASQGQSAIPWNRPQQWEGPGVYGSALGQQ